ncbi:hypothetical protein ABPG72_013813 [Tetrahymena utriculariae]
MDPVHIIQFNSIIKILTYLMLNPQKLNASLRRKSDKKCCCKISAMLFVAHRVKYLRRQILAFDANLQLVMFRQKLYQIEVSEGHHEIEKQQVQCLTVIKNQQIEEGGKKFKQRIEFKRSPNDATSDLPL